MDKEPKLGQEVSGLAQFMAPPPQDDEDHFVLNCNMSVSSEASGLTLDTCMLSAPTTAKTKVKGPSMLCLPLMDEGDEEDEEEPDLFLPTQEELQGTSSEAAKSKKDRKKKKSSKRGDHKTQSRSTDDSTVHSCTSSASESNARTHRSSSQGETLDETSIDGLSKKSKRKKNKKSSKKERKRRSKLADISDDDCSNSSADSSNSDSDQHSKSRPKKQPGRLSSAVLEERQRQLENVSRRSRNKSKKPGRISSRVLEERARQLGNVRRSSITCKKPGRLSLTVLEERERQLGKLRLASKSSDDDDGSRSERKKTKKKSKKSKRRSSIGPHPRDPQDQYNDEHSATRSMHNPAASQHTTDEILDQLVNSLKSFAGNNSVGDTHLLITQMYSILDVAADACTDMAQDVSYGSFSRRGSALGSVSHSRRSSHYSNTSESLLSESSEGSRRSFADDFSHSLESQASQRRLHRQLQNELLKAKVIPERYDDEQMPNRITIEKSFEADMSSLFQKWQQMQHQNGNPAA